MTSARHNGFTLIELMVTVAVAAILLSVAVPSFSTLLDNNRAATAANEVLTSTQYARSEAVKRARQVSLCPSTDGATCTGGTTWNTGWVISFVNDGGATEVLRVTNPFPAGVAIAGPTTVVFQAAGNVQVAPNNAFFALTVGTASARSVCMEASGRTDARKAEDCS